MTQKKPEVVLFVGNMAYDGWKSIRVTRSIESLAGSFALEVSDRWRGDEDPWPIVEGYACRVEIHGQVVIDGYVDKRSLRGSATERSLSYSGRDRAAALVDCSLLVEEEIAGPLGFGHKWAFKKTNIAQFAAAIAAPHGIKVSVQDGLVLKEHPVLVAHPGETCFEGIRRVAGSDGVLVISDGAGGILITRAGTARAASLREGVNILSAEVDYDATDRFFGYLVSAQSPGTDEAFGEATRVEGFATDAAVLGTDRVLLIRAENAMDFDEAKKRANWESRIRAAKATTATVTVQGWRQPAGDLWPINTLTHVKAPRLIGVDGDMLISQVEYSMGDGGEVTQLHLVRPDAFTPEPPQTVAAGTSGRWKELDAGGLEDPKGQRLAQQKIIAKILSSVAPLVRK